MKSFYEQSLSPHTMLIKKTDFSDNSDSSNFAHSATDYSVSSRDASFFSSMLEGSTANKTVSTSPAAPSLFVDASNQLSDSMKRFIKLARPPKEGLDFENFKTLPRDLFNAQLMPHVLVKCLAKTTQGVDKICNLQ
ncbi:MULTISPECIES: type III secretion protein [Pseudomonas]|nr:MULTISPECIES: type III secretion protein [Pseudomonas]NWE00447.1 type III secretion protein [Pseudomonas sp. IPO3749]NWF18493.1 type III secretion protein [Pseudomonas sp. IPO3749]